MLYDEESSVLEISVTELAGKKQVTAVTPDLGLLAYTIMGETRALIGGGGAEGGGEYSYIRVLPDEFLLK